MQKILKALDHKKFLNVYDLMRQAFPSAQIRAYEKAYSILNHPDYQISVIQDHKNGIGGFIAAWDFRKFRFVEHFAVSKGIRGAGIGSAMMQEYLAQSAKPVLIEVEAQETKDAKRRVEFYRRLGFSLSRFGYQQPALQNVGPAPYLKVMSCPRTMTEAEFHDFQQIVFSRVYKVA